MKARCFNPKNKNYSRYGARRITVCPEWKDDFLAFYSYIGPRPSAQHSIDRFPNNDGNYEPGNVRWATPVEQANNTSRNVILRGSTIAEIGRAVRGIPLSTIYRRAAVGFGADRAVEPKDFRFKVANDVREAIVADYRAGLLRGQLSCKYNTSKSTVSRIIKTAAQREQASSLDEPDATGVSS